MRVSRTVAAVVLAGSALIASTGGVGAADAASTYKDKTITRTSDDGWKVSLTKSGERIQSVPALSRGHGSYEAFLDLRGSATITGAGVRRWMLRCCRPGFRCRASGRWTG